MLALDAKPLICKMLEEKAVSYSEPEKKVMLWSGDDCVVALTIQWYLLYGEEECFGWRMHGQCMEFFNDEVCHHFFVRYLRWGSMISKQPVIIKHFLGDCRYAQGSHLETHGCADMTFHSYLPTLWGIYLVWDFPKGGFGVKVGWSLVNTPDFVLQQANKSDVIVRVRKALHNPSIIQDCQAGGGTFQAIHCTHFYCREVWWVARGTAWRFFKFGIQSFAPDVEAMAAAKSSSLG